MSSIHQEPLKNPPQCPECGSAWLGGLTCESCFHQMLYWENELPARGIVHHLAVLAYHLQHPGLLSPEGVKYSCKLLVDFVEGGATPQRVLEKDRRLVDSRRRRWHIRSATGSPASYPNPVVWSRTAHDVVAAGAEQYIVSVQEWAHQVLYDLRATGNLLIN